MTSLKIASVGAVLLAVGLLHAHLESSVPEDGAVLASPPDSIVLVFSDPVSDRLAEGTLVLAAGERRWELSLEGDTANARIVRADLPALDAGAYRVDWRVVSADGHPVSGEVTFMVEAGDGVAGSGEDDAADPAEVPPGAELPPPGGPEERMPWLAAVLRGAGLGALMALAGLLSLSALGPEGPMEHTARLERWLALAAPVLLAAHLAAWLAYVAPASGEGLRRMLPGLGTDAGRLELLRTAFAATAGGTLIVGGRRGLAAALAFAGVLVSAALGHAAAEAPLLSVPLKALHLAAVAAWIGGVGWLAAGVVRPEAYGRRARTVSSVALASVIVVVATGVLQTWVLVPELGDLLGSSYGLGVGAKVAGALALVAFGARHRTRHLPRLGGDGGEVALVRSVRAEAGLMLVVLLVAGVLAYLPLPGAPS